MTRARIVLTDDHVIVRASLASLLEVRGFTVVGQSDTLDDTLAACRTGRPDILVTDLMMPSVNSIALIEAARALDPAPAILVLSGSRDPRWIAAAFRAGCSGYVGKADGPERLLTAIHAVLAGKQVIPADLSVAISEEMARPPRPEVQGSLELLTRREKQVLYGIASGERNAQIGKRLGISKKTVDAHRQNMCAKINADNNADLTRFAIRHGLCTL